MAATAKTLGAGEVGKDLPRPLEDRAGGEERVLLGGERRNRACEALQLRRGSHPGMTLERAVAELLKTHPGRRRATGFRLRVPTGRKNFGDLPLSRTAEPLDHVPEGGHVTLDAHARHHRVHRG